MISFKDFILVEAGDNPHNFHQVETDGYGTRYEFNADGTQYSTTIDHLGSKHAEVTFGNRHIDTDFGPHTSYHTTGDQGLKSARILSTVHHIIKRHLANHPEIHTVGFTSDTNEPSRVALYKRYTKRLGGTSHDSSEVYDTMVHTIPASSYRSK